MSLLEPLALRGCPSDLFAGQLSPKPRVVAGNERAALGTATAPTKTRRSIAPRALRLRHRTSRVKQRRRKEAAVGRARKNYFATRRDIHRKGPREGTVRAQRPRSPRPTGTSGRASGFRPDAPPLFEVPRRPTEPQSEGAITITITIAIARHQPAEPGWDFGPAVAPAWSTDPKHTTPTKNPDGGRWPSVTAGQ